MLRSIIFLGLLKEMSPRNTHHEQVRYAEQLPSPEIQRKHFPSTGIQLGLDELEHRRASDRTARYSNQC